MPRPRVSTPKSETIVFRVTAEDKRVLEGRARDRALTLTEYLTRVGLGRSARQRADVDAINLLRECANELKEIHRTLQIAVVGESAIQATTMDRTMMAICAAIGRIWQR